MKKPCGQPPLPLPPLPRKSNPLPIYPMKKWFYFILPVVMSAIFLVFYFQHEKEREARTEQNMRETASKIAAEKAVKDAAEAEAKKSGYRVKDIVCAVALSDLIRKR